LKNMALRSTTKARTVCCLADPELCSVAQLMGLFSSDKPAPKKKRAKPAAVDTGKRT